MKQSALNIVLHKRLPDSGFLRQRRLRPSVSWLCFLIGLLFSISNISAQQPVRVALRPVARSVDTDVITFSQVADVTGGQPQTRAAIAKLDLALTPTQQQQVLSRSEAMARLLLAGFERSDFELTGSNAVRILGTEPIPWAELVAQSIQKRVSETLNLDQQDVSVQLQTDIEDSAIAKSPVQGNIRLAPLDHGDRLVGRTKIEMGVFSGNALLNRFHVLAYTTVARDVVISSKPIERGELIDQHNTYVERREFSNWRPNQYLKPADVGQVSRRRIRAQQILSATDVTSSTIQSGEILVRPRDLVTVVAQKNGLRISLSGMQVLKAGRVGDIVPVRNPTSKKTVYGRVRSSGLIELAY